MGPLTVADLLDLRAQGVLLAPVGDSLHIEDPRRILRPVDLDRLREAKSLFLALLWAERDNCRIPARPCYACKGRRYWFGGPGPIWACAVCHPPADPGFVRAWREVPEPARKGPSPAPETCPTDRESRRRTWADLSPWEQRITAKAREVHPEEFDRLLIGYFARGLVSGEAEIRVVLDLLDR